MSDKDDYKIIDVCDEILCDGIMGKIIEVSYKQDRIYRFEIHPHKTYNPYPKTYPKKEK